MINQTIRILLLCDQQITAQEVEEALSKSNLYYTLIPHNDLSSLTTAIDRYEPDVVISETTLGDRQWKEILPLLRKESPELSIVFLVEKQEESQVIDIIAAGANDFILREKLLRLVPVIQRSYLEVSEKRYLKQVTRQKGYYDFIVNNSKSMVSVINREYKYEAINTAFCDAHNLVKDQVLGRSLGEIWGEENFHRNIRNHLVESFSDNVVRYQAWFDVPESGNRCFEVTFFPYREKGKDITHSVVNTMDVTEQKLAEIALLESEANYKSLVMNLPVGVFRTDPEGNLQQVNPSLLRILQVQEHSDLLNQNLKDFFSEPSRFREYMKRLLRERILSGEDEIFTTARGKIIKVRISGLVKMNREQQVEHIDGTIEDRTRQAELESQLRQAQKMETIGTLAGGIAHDFNNILATITGYAEMSLEDLDDSSPLYANMLQIHKATQRSKSLVKQILTFSRQMEQQKIPVRVDLILNETLEFLRVSISKNIKIKTVIKARSETVQADPTQVHQVVMNICANAVQAMGEQGGSLSVYLRKATAREVEHRFSPLEEKNFLLFTVEDTGPGMEEAVRDRIFEPFFTTRAVGEGTGLGLSVVHGIVKEIGGAIFVDSSPGKGTRFDVYFPVTAEEPKEKESVEISAGGEEHLVVVDDEPPVGNMYKMALERMGYRVTLFTNSPDALEYLKQQGSQADMLIVDQLMPELSGREIAAILYKKNPGLPVILLSGFRHENGNKDKNLTNIKGYLMKPISLSELNHAIRKVFNESEQKQKTK